MLQFPQLNEAEFQELRDALQRLVDKTGVSTALLVESAGYLIVGAGELQAFDPAQLATLAANAFAAAGLMAQILGNTQFNSMSQQGDHLEVVWRQIDENCMVVVVFPPKVGLGFVRFHAEGLAKALGTMLAAARERSPGRGLDLSDLNPRNPTELFRSGGS